MADVRTATADLFEEKPELEGDLEAVLAVDAEHETWEFADIPLDSGTFGELVSRGIVEKVEGEYALADPDAVTAALHGDESLAEDGTESEGSSRPFNVSTSVRGVVDSVRVDRRVAIVLLGALSLVVLFRVLPYPSVFRGGDVVLSGNDPYFYRYHVHQLLAESTDPLDFSVLSSLPSQMAHGEPLMVAALWFASALLGGASAVGGVLAWYPVLSAVVTALLVSVLTVRVTEDRRAGFAAVALLAIIPAHAFRTGLGFADHHAFDYPWLALTALAVVSLARDGRPERKANSEWKFRDGRTWAWALVLGVGVGGQTLAWDAGPLLLVPLALYALAVVPSWLRADRSPLIEGWPLVVGTGVGALLVVWAHVSFGWHTQAVVAAPALLVGGMVGVLALGEGARRVGASVRSVVGAEIGGLIVGVVVLWAAFPPFVAELDRGIDFLVSTGGIAETMSLVSGDLGTLVGPIFLFGFALFLAVPYLAWASWRAYRSLAPRCLLASVYGWYFLVLALIQIRFAGQLALFAAVFGGLGFVHVAAWVDLAAYPAPFGADESGTSPISPDGRRARSSENDPPELEWPERREA
ncbi:MAG: STT3 domain-containing protein, partial [Halorhabdus sp.]